MDLDFEALDFDQNPKSTYYSGVAPLQQNFRASYHKIFVRRAPNATKFKTNCSFLAQFEGGFGLRLDVKGGWPVDLCITFFARLELELDWILILSP